MTQTTRPNDLRIECDSFPSNECLADLMAAAWGHTKPHADSRENNATDYSVSLRHCLAHVTAHHQDKLVGFAKLASDGKVHAFLLDPTVHPDFQHAGLGTQLVAKLVEAARLKGMQYIHVDFEPQLTNFYNKCGFSPTAAGLLRL